MLAMEEELMNAAGNNDAGGIPGGAVDTIEVTVSVVFDEADKNSLNLDLFNLFGSTDKPFSIKVSTQSFA
jgi:hypothetical protein